MKIRDNKVHQHILYLPKKQQQMNKYKFVKFFPPGRRIAALL